MLVVARGRIIAKLRVHQRLTGASTAASLPTPPSLCVVVLRQILIGRRCIRCIAIDVIAIVITIVIIIVIIMVPVIQL